jgi:hypothetical protein
MWLRVLGQFGTIEQPRHLVERGRHRDLGQSSDDPTLRTRLLDTGEERDEDTYCGWAPLQVEVWSVDRTDLPTPVVVRDQRGDPA